MCHVNFDNIIKISNTQAVRDLPKLMKPTNSLCKECQLGIQSRVSFKSKDQSSTRLLELVHTDLCGPTRIKSLQGDRYFMLLIDDHSQMMWVTFLKEKLEAFEKFKNFKAMVENQTRLKLKCLRSDRGGEFTSGEFIDFCEKQGIRRQLFAPRTPQQNGVVERKNRTIQEATRTMMLEANFPQMFWKEAISTAVYTLNRVQIRNNTGKTPYELWFGITPPVKYFRVFGSKCYIKRDEDLGKFDARSDAKPEFIGGSYRYCF